MTLPADGRTTHAETTGGLFMLICFVGMGEDCVIRNDREAQTSSACRGPDTPAIAGDLMRRIEVTAA
jgi:hypothetical protein